MIHPSQAWCLQISTNSLCWPKGSDGSQSQCSNCTRGGAHETKRYIMSLEHIELALQNVAAFATESSSCPQDRRKVIGLFGMEPLYHPNFPEIVDLYIKYIPDVFHRGLWTSLPWPTFVSPKWGAAKPHVDRMIGKGCEAPRGPHRETQNRFFPSSKERQFGYLNWNQHTADQRCEHQPMWVSSTYLVDDEVRRWELIQGCWTQINWSPIVAYNHWNQPKFYFCEVASTHDRLFDLNVGIDLDPDCWRHTIRFERNAQNVPQPLGRYSDQIKACCPGCGSCVPLPGRRDLENKDDISPDNVARLQAIGSPMVIRGDFVPFDEFAKTSWNEQQHKSGWNPQVYVKEKAKA